VMFGLAENKGQAFAGLDGLKQFIDVGRHAQLGENAGPALVQSADAAAEFVELYQLPSFTSASFSDLREIQGYIGLDGGSTSSKCVLINEEGEILHKVYRLSKGNPLEDMRVMFQELKDWASNQNAELTIQGFGVTGYAGDVMETALKADANIVETVAHMKSAQHYFPNVDVICDVGGQDIKVLFMENAAIKNFKLSNSCSAGNGMLLQAMADQFGIPITEYSEKAFNAELSPTFAYGCAVFLDSDRVNFQKEGYNAEELLAGLALVLPKNIWQYVVQIPRMAELGRVFVLQGGTQKNLAAVKAQVDYICERVPDAEVHVHPHTGEAGALGAAFEAVRVVKRRGYSSFIGLTESIELEYSTRNDESTRCDFCANNCSRTFVDVVVPDKSVEQKAVKSVDIHQPDTYQPDSSKPEIARYISGFSCEKGTVEDHDALRALNKQRRERMKVYPNLVDYEATWNFKHWYKPDPMPVEGSKLETTEVVHTWLGKQKHKQVTRRFERSGQAAQDYRHDYRIGMPKALNMWTTGPFWRAYFESLGIRPRNVVFSDDTSEELWQAGGKYGSVDPCYPAKVVQAHIHNLMFVHHEKKPLNAIFFPSITHIPSYVEQVQDVACCTIVAGTPKVIGATFTKETDFFAQRNIQYFDTAVSLNEPELLKQRLFEQFESELKITRDESNFAVEQAFKAWRTFDQMMQEKGRAILDEVEAENRVAILMTGRPYHNDPGMNHGVLEEYQAMGYPILSMRSIPKDKDYLNRYFAEDLRKGHVDSPLEIQDIWPENYSVNSVQKVWATKFATRHPNVAVLDLSSFKCGMDAPTYGLVDRMVAASGSAYSSLHDIDANKPSGSIKIRVKTYAYTLGLAQEALQDQAARKKQLDQSIVLKRLNLLMAAPESLRETPEIQAEITRLESLLGEQVDEQLAQTNSKKRSSVSVVQPLAESEDLIPMVVVD
ncbi:MAG: acyl-CoA dehydratase activase-related protein, partial [Oceanobacter sp.]